MRPIKDLAARSASREMGTPRRMPPVFWSSYGILEAFPWRLIPSFAILASNVAGLRPRISVAPLVPRIRHPVCSSTRRICRLFIVSSVILPSEGAFERDGISTSKTGPLLTRRYCGVL